MEWINAETAAVSGAVIAAAFALWQARVNRVRQVEDVYVRRYWDILDRLPLAVLRGAPARRCGRSADQDVQRAVRLYFRLSEDQADLRAQGWVSDVVWKEWEEAIRTTLSRWPFAGLWRLALEDAGNKREYAFTHLRRIGERTAYDPRATSWYRRQLRRWVWWRGLPGPRPGDDHRG